MKRKQRDDGFGEDEDRGEGFGMPEEADPALDSDVDVECPYCGEVVAITLDAGGGATQAYIEDCQVCCRPWQVYVHYDAEGAADVRVEQAS